MIPVIYKSTDNMMIQLLRQTGGGYSTDDGEILLFNDTTREILRTVAEHAETGAFSTFKISSYPANFLNAGPVHLRHRFHRRRHLDGHRRAPVWTSARTRSSTSAPGCTPVPQCRSRPDAQMISQGPSVCVFNKEDPQEVLASWLLAQFLAHRWGADSPTPRPRAMCP